MENKLQELTDRLYREGLSKGKEEGEAVLAKAKEQASEIIETARKEAASIMDAARKEAAAFKTKMEGDVKMAATQSIQATRNDIENLMLHKIVDAPVESSLSDEGFLKEVLMCVAKNFSAQQAQDLSVVLPEKLRDNLEPFVKGELAKAVGKGIEATFSQRVSGGFTIGPKDGSYFISMTDETFKELIGAYLRPTAKKLLFGE